MANLTDASKMHLRDHFAGQIAAALMGGEYGKADDAVAIARVANRAYKLADALMEERIKSLGPASSDPPFKTL